MRLSAPLEMREGAMGKGNSYIPHLLQRKSANPFCASLVSFCHVALAIHFSCMYIFVLLYDMVAYL